MSSQAVTFTSRCTLHCLFVWLFQVTWICASRPNSRSHTTRTFECAIRACDRTTATMPTRWHSSSTQMLPIHAIRGDVRSCQRATATTPSSTNDRGISSSRIHRRISIGPSDMLATRLARPPITNVAGVGAAVEAADGDGVDGSRLDLIRFYH